MAKQSTDPPRGGDPPADEQLRKVWEEFGRDLRDLRIDRGLGIGQLAERAKVSRQTVVDLERGWRQTRGDQPRTLVNPKDEILGGIARALGVPVDRFYAKVGRYADRPQTHSSRRGHALNRSDEDRLAELEARMAKVEELLAQRGTPEPTEPSKRRRRPAG